MNLCEISVFSVLKTISNTENTEFSYFGKKPHKYFRQKNARKILSRRSAIKRAFPGQKFNLKGVFFMKLKNIFGAFAFLFVILGIFTNVQAQDSGYKISAPYTYKNLTIFLIHGKDQSAKKNILTLQEAMERKIFVVYETSNVNELAVENLSKEFDVFIQSGDIVKGGKQDRVLAISIIIPARSGRILIQAFCVESDRWTKRGDEETSKFSTSNDRIVTKGLKLAANKSRSQSEVWDKVEEAQEKLSQNVGGSVNSADSKTSLQLSLENKKVAATIDEYVKKLSQITAGKPDVIGYAFAVNGEINSADIYVSNALFKKLWLKMLKASAIEAVSESDKKKSAFEVKSGAVKTFLADAEKGKSEEKAVSNRVKVITRENKENVVFETRDEKQNAVIHKSYVKIQ